MEAGRQFAGFEGEQQPRVPVEIRYFGHAEQHHLNQ